MTASRLQSSTLGQRSNWALSTARQVSIRVILSVIGLRRLVAIGDRRDRIGKTADD